MNPTQMQAELDRLRTENARLKASKGSGRALSFKVTDKGAVSVYGLQRFPVTLYRGQWEKLIEAIPSLNEFIIANIALLSEKDDVKPVVGSVQA